MSKRSLKNIFTMLIVMSICMAAISIVTAQGANETATPVQTTIQPVQTPSTTVTQPVVVTEVKEKKFRVGPTVRIRPLNDEINKNQDGLIELYMDNPSLNDMSLSVDARISVPSGIHVYGQGFGDAGAAGMVYGKFDVPPGGARTINIVIKADKIGDFNAQFTGLYWPGDNKDAYQPISLTHPFKVTAPSKDPLKDTSGDTGGKEKASEKSPGISAVIVIFAITIVSYMIRNKIK